MAGQSVRKEAATVSEDFEVDSEVTFERGMLPRVTVSISATVNTGRYENIKPMAALSVSAKEDNEEAINEAFERCWALVEAEVTKQVEKVREALSNA